MYFPLRPNRGEGFLLRLDDGRFRLIYRLPDRREPDAVTVDSSIVPPHATGEERLGAVLVTRESEGMRVLLGSEGASSFIVPVPSHEGADWPFRTPIRAKMN